MITKDMLYRLASVVRKLSPEVETLSYTLHYHWLAASDEFRTEFTRLKILDGATYNRALYSSLRNVKINSMTSDLGEVLKGPVTDVLSLIYTVGAAESDMEMTEDLIEKLRDDLSSERLGLQVVGYATAYFERFIEPAILKVFERIDMEKPTAAKVGVFKMALEDKIMGANYWNIIGSVFASRAYNFAILDAGYYSERKTYTIINPNDELSGEVCQGIVGRTFPVDKGISLAYSLETAAPGGDKLIYPWPNQDPAGEVVKLTDQELIDRGLILPPFHPHCRSQVELLT